MVATQPRLRRSRVWWIVVAGQGAIGLGVLLAATMHPIMLGLWADSPVIVLVGGGLLLITTILWWRTSVAWPLATVDAWFAWWGASTATGGVGGGTAQVVGVLWLV